MISCSQMFERFFHLLFRSDVHVVAIIYFNVDMYHNISDIDYKERIVLSCKCTIHINRSDIDIFVSHCIRKILTLLCSAHSLITQYSERDLF